MRKKTVILIGAFLISALSFAGENDDVKFLDQIYKRQNYDMAISESQRFLARYPKSKNLRAIHERMAKTLYFKQKYREAAGEFVKILSQYPSTPDEQNEYLYYAVKSYLLLEDEKTADSLMAKMNKNNIFYERALYDRGVIYLDRDEYEKAFKTFQTLAGTGKELGKSAVFNMALTSYNDDQYPLVIEILNRYVPLNDKNRDDSAVYYLYGSSYYKLDQVQNAIKYFELLSDKYPDTPYGKKAQVTLIEIYANMGNTAMVDRYSALVKGTPFEQEALSILGDYYVAVQQYAKAKDYYLKADINANPRALYGYAYSLFREEKIKEALPLFSKLESTSYYNQAIYYKFASYYKLKEYKKIVSEREEAKKIVVTQQDNDNINLIIANSAYELGDLPLARDYFTKLNLHTPSKDNLFRVITLSGKLNRAEDVVQRINDYHKLYPGDTEYKKRIYVAGAEALYNNGKPEGAEKLYRDYLKDSKDPEILSALTSLLINEKRYRDADSVLSVQETTSENVYLRAVAATGLGNYSAAEGLYVDVLSKINSSSDRNLFIKTKLNQIKNLFLSGKFQEAINEGETYLTYPDAIEKDDITEKLGISYFRINNFAKSREYYNKLSSEEAQFQIAESYMSEKNYSGAKNIYAKLYSDSSSEKNRELALYSLGKVAAESNNIAEYQKISAEFLSRYPESEFKSNFIANFSKVAGTLKKDSDIINSYTTIYQNSTEAHIKEEALEKLTESYIQSKKYKEAETHAQKINNPIKKAYFLSQVYEKTNKLDSASKEYVKLINEPEFREYAAANLAKYNFNRKNYTKAREYYAIISSIRNSSYRDVALFQMGFIDETNKKTDSAIKLYTQVFSEYPKSQLAEDAKMKTAQLHENKNINEAVKLYIDLAKNSKNSKYKVFALEKLVFLNLKNKQIKTAREYHAQLKKLDANTAAKYDDFLKEGN